ncbi:MAG: hypothetical protein HC831_14020 [Chloroflexia bacterium]|nr:hypothetical protein [Chloroflexia bacterium]
MLLGLLYWMLYGLVWALVYRLVGRSNTLETDIILYKASISHSILSTIYAFILRLSADWVIKIQQQKYLEKQKNEMELALLYSKINPSFYLKP